MDRLDFFERDLRRRPPDRGAIAAFGGIGGATTEGLLDIGIGCDIGCGVLEFAPILEPIPEFRAIEASTDSAVTGGGALDPNPNAFDILLSIDG